MTPQERHWENVRRMLAQTGHREGDPLPRWAQMAKTATASGVRWAREGFRQVRPDTLEQRRATCRACEHWDADAFLGTGRCRKCGCGGAKLRLPHEKCPVGKWAPEEPAVTAGPDPSAG